MVDGGQQQEALLTFQRENVRLNESQIEDLVNEPGFANLVPLAQSTVYDTLLTASATTPTPTMLSTSIPITILRGDAAAPILITACERLATAMPGTEVVVVP